MAQGPQLLTRWLPPVEWSLSYIEALRPLVHLGRVLGLRRDHACGIFRSYNHQAWHCTASFRAFIVIGVAAVFGAACTQSSAFGLRQREGHRAAALPALFMNRSKEVYSSIQQCELGDNGVRFTAVKESISLRPGFMAAQVGSIF